MRKLLLLLSVAALVSVSGCSWFQKPAPVVQVRYKSLPYPYMSAAQTKVMIACLKAYGGNEKRSKRLGKEAVEAAGQYCLDNFDAMYGWWFVFVVLSDSYDKLDQR